MTSGIRRIVFWEPSVSPHKTEFFTAAAAHRPHVEIICVADRELLDSRRALGWEARSNSYRAVVSPTQEQISEIAQEDVSGTFHVFSGIRWVPTLVAGLRAARENGCRFALMSEPRVKHGWRGPIRLLQSWVTEGWLRRQAAVILAQGRHGPAWFRLAGYPGSRIFPFAYFVDPPRIESPNFERRGRIVIGFVGRLEVEKGIFDIPIALKLLDGPVELKVAGVGQQAERFKAECSRYGVKSTFLGSVPRAQIGNLLAEIDVLVLPSLTEDDGWGVAVSEALMSGAAVVASSRVGSSVVLDGATRGICVPHGNPQLIADAITALKTSNAFSTQSRAARQDWAIGRLSSAAGARHFFEILDYATANVCADRPQPFYS